MGNTARDFMITPVVSVTADLTLQELAQLLSKNNFSGVPVVDSTEKVIGILSDTDLIRFAQKLNVVPLKDLTGWISPYTEVEDIAAVRRGIDQLSKTTVDKVMTRKVYTVSEDSTIREIAQLMNRRNINRVPVIDKQERLVGIITRADLVSCMAQR